MAEFNELYNKLSIKNHVGLVWRRFTQWNLKEKVLFAEIYVQKNKNKTLQVYLKYVYNKVVFEFDH